MNKVIEINNENKKINIFKKIIYSIAKPSKYSQMASEGNKSAIHYFLLIILIVTTFLSIASLYSLNEFVKSCGEYLENNLPDLSYEDGILTSEGEQGKVLNNEFIDYITGIEDINVVIDTSEDAESKLSEYIDSIGTDKNIAILLKDKIVLIKVDGDETEQTDYNYADVLKEYYGSDVESLTKQEFLDNIPKQISYSYFFGVYFIGYLINNIIVNLVYIVLLSLIGYLLSKTMKILVNYKDLLKFAVYALTLPSIVYILCAVISMFVTVPSDIISAIYILSIYVYLLLVLFSIRNKEKNSQNKASRASK